jgi:hypothetical protein
VNDFEEFMRVLDVNANEYGYDDCKRTVYPGEKDVEI